MEAYNYTSKFQVVSALSFGAFNSSAKLSDAVIWKIEPSVRLYCWLPMKNERNIKELLSYKSIFFWTNLMHNRPIARKKLIYSASYGRVCTTTQKDKIQIHKSCLTRELFQFSKIITTNIHGRKYISCACNLILPQLVNLYVRKYIKAKVNLCACLILKFQPTYKLCSSTKLSFKHD